MGTEGLRAVLHQQQLVILGDPGQRGHVGRLAEQVHWQDRARARRDGRGHGLGIDVEGAGIDVDEHGLGAHVADRLRGGDEREGRGDHLVPGPEIGRAQREVQRVGAGSAGDRVAYPEILGQLVLQCLHVRPENESRALEHVCDRGIDLVPEFVVLALQVDHRDHSSSPSPMLLSVRVITFMFE